MCTFSLSRHGNGYVVRFNRDEQHRRADEVPPIAAADASGRRFVAPIDGHSGGTWIVANAAGLVVCVLNDYLRPTPAPATAGRQSRGQLPLAARGATSPLDAIHAVRTALSAAGGATRFPPFQLLAIGRNGDMRRLHWNGADLAEPSADDFHTSSSFAPAAVAQRRRAAYLALGAERAADPSLDGLHWLHRPEQAAESVRMWRDDACTRSITEVMVTSTTVRMRHHRIDWNRTDGRGAVTEVSL